MISIVRGNDFTLSIPVEIQRIESGTTITEPFDLDGAKVTVNISNPFKRYLFDFTTEGNTVIIQIDGTKIGNGTYNIEIIAKKGDNFRSCKLRQFKIVESNEESNIPSSAEFEVNVHQLDAHTLFNFNADGGGGTGITVDSSLSPTSTNPVQNKVITAEFKKKVEKVDGKGLSTNDYTTDDKNRLAGLSNYNDTSINKAISDETTRAAAAEYALDTTKVDKISGKGLSENDYTSLEKQKLSGLPSNAYSKNEIDATVSKIREDIGDIQVDGSSSPYTRGRMKKIHVVISNLPSDTYSVKHCTLKYNADNVISFTTDDANTSSLSVVWAAINKRPISCHSNDVGGSGKTYQYHANQYLAKDIPSDIVYKTYTDHLTYNTIFGTKERFRHGVALWAYARNKDGYFMDRVQPIDPNANHLFRFMSPYLNWEDCNLMKHYGTDFYYHNIGTEDFGCDKDILSVIQGLNSDLSHTKLMTGRIMKILARPDGNNTFLDAMNEMPKIDMGMGESTPAVDCKPNVETEYFHKVWSRRFSDDIEGELKPRLASLINSVSSNDKLWFHFCCHTATGAWADFMKFISDSYGNNVSDKNKRLWFCTAGELYEYMYFKKYGRFINIKSGSTTLEFDYEFPFKENFNYKDVTFKITNSTSSPIAIESIDAYDLYTNEKVYSCQTAPESDGALINLNIEETFIENLEFYISKYEETSDSIWREDAELELPKLIPSLCAQYQARIDAVSSPVNITILSLNKSSLNLTNSVSDTITITALPVDNSQMSKLTYTLRDISNLNVTLSAVNNVVTATMTNINKNAGTYNGFIKFGVTGSSVVSEEVSIQVVVESTVIDKPITSLQLECDTTIDKNQPLPCVCTALPDDSIGIEDIVITTTGNVVDKHIISNKISFSIIWDTAQTDIVVVSAGEVTVSKSITINEIVTPLDDNIVCFVFYSYADMGSEASLQDATYGGMINIENGDSLSIIDNKPVYSKSEKLLSDWKRLGNEQEEYVKSLGKNYNKWGASPIQSGNTSNVFTTLTLYKAVSKYNSIAANCLMYKVPNGYYKIRFLSSTTESSDSYDNGAIYINEVDVTSQLPTGPYGQKQVWTDYINVDITSGKLIILVEPKLGKRIGFNAIEIEKIY